MTRLPRPQPFYPSGHVMIVSHPTSQVPAHVVPMDELVAFILAQYDDDERVARAASQDAWSEPYGEFQSRGGEQFAHILRHSPDAVLADIESKRRIVARYTDAREQASNLREQYRSAASSGVNAAHLLEEAQRWDSVVTVLEGPVRDLGEPYASRDGYKETWRP